MSLTHVERLRAVGNGFTGKLVWLSMGVGRRFEPPKHWGTCCKMMNSAQGLQPLCKTLSSPSVSLPVIFAACLAFLNPGDWCDLSSSCHATPRRPTGSSRRHARPAAA
jgi:hypothetical protein